MAETGGVEIRQAGAVLQLRLARPERHNALTPAMMDRLTEAALRIAADPGVRVVRLEAAGATFCAGGDLAWMQAQAAATAEARGAEARRLSGMLAALDSLPQVVIAAVQGPAWGGGVGLISVSDIAVGVDSARFGLTETRLGLVPATIGPAVLARIGAPALRALALTGRSFDAAEALRLGLLSRVVAGPDLPAALAEETAAALKAAPGAVAATKAMFTRPAAGALTAEDAIAALAARWTTEEARSGLAAFFARRPPPWAEDDPSGGRGGFGPP
jgi:methylglutaconyl-CoA hydratase